MPRHTRPQDHKRGGPQRPALATTSRAPQPAAVGPGLDRPRLMTCPHCTAGYYAEARDDVGRVSGYCTSCCFEVAKPPIRKALEPG